MKGIFTPLIVPLDERGAIHESELRRYVDWLIKRGVHGLYPNGSTGEFTRFTPEERQRIVQIVCEQTAGRVPVLAGAAEPNVRETITVCETYLEYGAVAVAVVSPYYYKLSSGLVYEYFAEIARHSPINLTLYNIPLFASPIELDTAQRLAEFERIIGIKDSSGKLPFMMRLIEAIRPYRPDFVFFNGWEPLLVPMMLAGCDGGINASSGVVPELTRAVYNLTNERKIDDAMKLQHQLMRVFDTMFYSADFPEGFRAGAELRGFQIGLGRQPLDLDQKNRRLELQRVLRNELSTLDLVSL